MLSQILLVVLACSMFGTATTPTLGYGVRMFPFAERRDGKFQLRIIAMSSLESGIHFHKAARGTLQHHKCHDFYADRIRVSFQDAMPYQVGGDAKGYRNELVFGISKHPITMIGRA